MKSFMTFIDKTLPICIRNSDFSIIKIDVNLMIYQSFCIRKINVSKLYTLNCNECGLIFCRIFFFFWWSIFQDLYDCTSWVITITITWLYIMSCRGAVVAERIRRRTSIPEVPCSSPGRGSCALGQGALSSLPSLSEETLSRRSRV